MLTFTCVGFQMFEEYDDNEIGALDCEEIEGFVPSTSERLLECVAEFDKRDPSEVNIFYGTKLCFIKCFATLFPNLLFIARKF